MTDERRIDRERGGDFFAINSREDRLRRAESHPQWVERYRPQNLANVILAPNLREILAAFVEREDAPNLMVSGPPGIGKTTMVHALLDELDKDVFTINASMDRGIDVVRGRIGDFAYTVSFRGGRKFVLFEEADALTTQSQEALRSLIEETSKNCGFIFICNDPSRMIEALHSRCAEIEFASYPGLEEAYQDRACKILRQEGIEHDNDDVADYIRRYSPDFRRVLNELQANSVGGKLQAMWSPALAETGKGTANGALAQFAHGCDGRGVDDDQNGNVGNNDTDPAPLIPDLPAQKFEPPRPLMREYAPANPFPVDALGSVLGPAARAIHDRVRAPLAICGNSVLAAATLAVQGHANVELPMGQTKPLSSFFVTIAATGERKSAVDTEALWPVRKHEATLCEKHAVERHVHETEMIAWHAARKEAIRITRDDPDAAVEALGALGPPPLPPLDPLMTCQEPTFEGLCKMLATGQPSLGIFAAEGGQFVGGHGMVDAKLRTATGLSMLWDGDPIKRVRAHDDPSVLAGRRVAVHLMVQPDVAAMWLSDNLLNQQGLMSRILLAAPEPTSGTRLWRDPSPETEPTIRRYRARLLEILERPLPMAKGSHNELAPRTLPLSPAARRLWVSFHDDVESRLGPGGELEPVRSFANKLPEHAARIAAVLTLIGNIEAGEVGSNAMDAGIALAQHYKTEALRLFGASLASPELREAQRLLTWLHTRSEPRISLPDIYQRGPSSIRDAKRARRAVAILEDHGHLVRVAVGEIIDGVFRREVWRTVRE